MLPPVTRFLLATASVHTTAAACDYLAERLTEGDSVVAVTVAEGGGTRDGGDALNVARVRLPGVTVDTERRSGDPGAEILAAAADNAVDEVVIGPKSGAPGADTDVGGTARRVLSNADRPVVVLPVPELA